MTYQLMIIDFDGTLADTMPFMLSVSDQLADRHHLPRMDKTDLPFLKGLNPAKFMQLHKIPLWKIPILAGEVQALMFENIEQINLFEGMDLVLRELSQKGVKIAVVSSNALKNVKKVLGAELSALVSQFECGVSMFGKAEKLARVLKNLGTPAGQALSLGDEIRDIEAAKRAGIPCAAVTWGFSLREVLEKYQPDHIIEAVDQIPGFF